jgi:hypothetical protein
MILNISVILGMSLATLFVGFLAYKINELPLTIIVVCSLALMAYSFFDEYLRGRRINRNGNGL